MARAERLLALIQVLRRHRYPVSGQAIVKGLRAPTDFESEFQQGLMNRKLAPEIETVCLLTNLQQLFISSSLLKEVARLGGDVADMLPPSVMRALQKKLGTEQA